MARGPPRSFHRCTRQVPASGWKEAGELRRELADAEERAVQWRRYALALEDDHLKMIGELPLGKRPKN